MTATHARERRSQRRPSRWRRLRPRWRWLFYGLVGLAGLIVLGILVGVIGYFTTSIPRANALVHKQITYVYDADGKTLLGTLGTVDRVSVPLSDVPQSVQDAVLAAEDRNFYAEPGVSPTGIMRALWTDVSGGDISQGGSTITQQYAKNAYLTQSRTFTRKIREIFIALKLAQTEPKAQILSDYLNTIYFGRGAYGIQAAARAYFRTDIRHVDAAQGALLAAIINAPSSLDPALNPAGARARWHYVVNGMVVMHALSRAEAAALRFPAVAPPPQPPHVGGPNGFILDAVQAELAQHGFDAAKLGIGGYRVTTTIEATDQNAAVNAVTSVMAGHHAANGGPLVAVVSIQPGNGAVRAMYGGADYANPHLPKSFVNMAYEPRQPGSSFKAYTLLTAFSQGVSLYSDYDGSSPMHVPGYGAAQQVSNDDNEQCYYPCSLVTATARSINTVFVPLALKLGPQNVRQMAYAAGVSRQNRLADPDGSVGAGITLGIYDVRPIDQANGYATIAAGGMRATPYLVASVTDISGHPLYRNTGAATRAFPTAVAANTDYALSQVLDAPDGTAYGHALPGRPAAGKTGTTTSSADAWFVGYTPQLSTAVWMGNAQESQPLTNVPGYTGGVYGGTLPAAIWQQDMTAALAGAPVQQFPAPSFTGGSATGSATYAPTAPAAPVSTSPPPTVAPSASPPSATPSASAAATGSPSIAPSLPPPSPTPSQPPPSPASTPAAKPSASSSP